MHQLREENDDIYLKREGFCSLHTNHSVFLNQEINSPVIYCERFTRNFWSNIDHNSEIHKLQTL